MTKYTILAAALALAGCQSATDEIVTPVPVVQSNADTVFEEREPDQCEAIEYVPYLSQPGTVIQTLGITKAYRVVAWRGIEAQEYDPQRLTFRLDASGNIYNIDCG
jgi:phage terminase large subunit-like protein